MLLYEMQKVIYQTLKPVLTVPIYDYYPDADEGSFPFVIIDEIEKNYNNDWSTRDSETVEISVMLNVWGDSVDRRKVNELMEIIECTLKNDLQTDEFHFSFIKNYSSRIARTQDNFVNGEVRLTYRTEE